MNEKKRDIPREALSLLLAIILALSALLPCARLFSAQPAMASSDTVTMRISGYIEYTDGSWHTHMYSTDDGEGEKYAYCVEPDKYTPEEGTYTKKTFRTLSGRTAEMRADLWFGFDGPGFDEAMWPSTNWNGDPMSDDDFYVLTHIMLAETFSSNGTYATYGTSSHFKKWFSKYISGRDLDTAEVVNETAVGRKIVKRIGEVPSDFECYLLAGADTQNLACSSYYPPLATLKMKKVSKNADITKDSECYSLEGIEYGVYTWHDCTPARDTGKRFVIDSKGKSEAITGLSPGLYFVREIESSVLGTGYSYSPNVYTCSVGAGETKWVHDTTNALGDVDGNDVGDNPTTYELDVLLHKYDMLTATSTPSGGGSFEGAIFEVRHFDNMNGDTSGTAKRTWTFKTDANGKVDLKNNERGCFVSGDALYRDQVTGAPVLPLGTYSVREITPPAGYELPTRGNPVVITLTQGGSGAHDVNSGGMLGNEGLAFPEMPVRHDLSFTKRDLDTQRPMARIPFLVSRMNAQGALVERHVVMTDANGMFDSSANHANHSYRTNANDTAVRVAGDGSYVVDEAALDPDAGVWFGVATNGNMTTANDEYGAFPDSTGDKYVFEELPVTANEGKALVTFDAYAHAAHSSTIDLGTVGNTTPTLATNAYDEADGDKLVSRDVDVTVSDTVSYAGLVAGRTYTIYGSLMDAATGAVLRDANGTEIRTTRQFIAASSAGAVELSFPFDASSIADGTKAVACEMLFEGNRPLAKHDDLDDSSQTVTIVQPSVETMASDAADGDASVTGDVDACIRDHVVYAGLAVGAQYQLDGVVMDARTGEPFLANGAEVRASMTFTPESASGALDMSFTFDAADLEPATKLVVFERISRGGTLIAAHEDIEDEGQSVSVFPPALATTATDPDDGDNVISADTQTVIKDKVEFSGLKPGREYLIEGTLVDKDTGRAMLDPFGCAITASHAFTPIEADGSTEVTFVFDGANVEGSALGVVFEELYRDGRHLASHVDLEDAPQTVLIEQPSIRTFASVDGLSKNVMRDEDASVIDTVSYRGVKAGKTYKLEGTLIERQSGQPIVDRDGTEVRRELEFTPEASEGTVELEFGFDATMFDEGSELVAFEKLTFESVTLASHEDPDDIKQTVTVAMPTIATSAKSKNDTKEVIIDTDATVTDTVSYENLMPGCEYVVSGTLVDKQSGQALVDACGQDVSAQTSFVPESASGEVSLDFVFDASNLEGGTKLVAFEKLMRDGREIASHEDIEDEEQTVTMQPALVLTTASDPEDGDQVILAREKVQIRDKVTYEGLQPGKEYEFVGVLMDKAAREPLANDKGEPIQASCRFTPNEQGGEVTVDFTCDASNWLEGKDVVVFEGLYRDGELIAEHADYENAAQTVVITPPQIRTHAANAADGGKQIIQGETATITDTVEYLALEPGLTYRLNGALMVNDGTLEGTPALDAFGVPISAQATFTPDASHGTVDVNFEVDTGIVREGTYLVAFETLTHGEVVQAEHADISDEEQTVQIVSPTEYAFVKGASATIAPRSAEGSTTVAGKAVDTGDTPMIAFAICSALAMLALLGLVWLRYRIVPEEKKK